MRTKSHSGRAKPKKMPSTQPFTHIAWTLPLLFIQHEQAGSLNTTVSETGSDGDGYKDGGRMGYDGVEKKCGLSPEIGFTSVQNCMRLDSVDREECIRCKCKRDGHVLICSEIGCPVAIHEKCMCGKPMFDDIGSFYCPYCSYKRALGVTRALRRNVRAAKKALSAFLDTIGGNKFHQKYGEDEKNEHCAVPLDTFHVEIETTVEEGVDNGSNEGVDTDIRVSEKNEPNLDSHVEKGTTVDDLLINLNGGVNDGVWVLDENNGRREDGEDLVLQGLDGPAHVEDLVLQGLDGPAHVDKPILQVHTRHIKRRAQRILIENVYSSGRLSPASRKSSKGPTIVAEATTSKTYQKSGKQFVSLNFPNAKRKRLYWSNEEEEMLKEGVARFSNANKNIPWRKILEFGCHVFNGTRTPADLKDKWKNIKD